MAIDSLFILNSSGTPLIQKHWCSDLAIQRATLVVLPAFKKYLFSRNALQDAIPVWSAPHQTTCIHIQRDKLIYMAVVSQEVPPLEVLELLEGVVRTLSEYIAGQPISEVVVKENFATIYQLLSEMVDSGNPVTTDSAVLKGLVPVPSLVNRVIENVSGIGIGSERRPDVNTSSTPWRAQGIRYSNNEFFVDIVEKIDAIISGTNGSVISYDVSGDIICKSNLSGMPDMRLALNQPDILDDVSFHPCVRVSKWEVERVIAFVPPDGQFKLASFHAATTSGKGYNIPRVLPLRISGRAGRNGQSHTIELIAQAEAIRSTTGVRPVENIQVRVPLPAQAYNITVRCKTGNHSVANQRQPQVEWTIKSLRPGSGGTVSLVIEYFVREKDSEDTVEANREDTSVEENEAATAFVKFEVAGYSASSLKVDSLKVLRESYKLFKGVRYITKAGSYQIRF